MALILPVIKFNYGARFLTRGIWYGIKSVLNVVHTDTDKYENASFFPSRFRLSCTLKRHLLLTMTELSEN